MRRAMRERVRAARREGRHPCSGAQRRLSESAGQRNGRVRTHRIALALHSFLDSSLVASVCAAARAAISMQGYTKCKKDARTKLSALGGS
eukprot:5010897-Pleurochrysis_carterae.AAC.3